MTQLTVALSLIAIFGAPAVSGGRILRPAMQDTAALRQAGWLDAPLTRWNTAGADLPVPPPGEPLKELSSRCMLSASRETPALRALADAGWMPFLMFDRALREGDVEIVGGMAAADGMCRPDRFNVFVFADGRYAGTLSPVLMSSRTDGTVGAVRLSRDGRIAAEFSRYTNVDALCCPSSRVTVQYRLDRQAHPVVEATGMKTTR